MRPNAAASLRERMGGRQPQRIVLLDNSFKTLLIDAQWTAEDVCEKMAEKMGFHKAETEAGYFALYSAENGVSGEAPRRRISSSERLTLAFLPLQWMHRSKATSHHLSWSIAGGLTRRGSWSTGSSYSWRA